MITAARVLRNFPGLTMGEIRHLPGPDLRVILAQLPRLEAQETLLQVQVSAYPHWSGSKSDKSAGDRARRDFNRRLQAQAYGGGRDHDSKGRRVLHNAKEFNDWLREGGVST